MQTFKLSFSLPDDAHPNMSLRVSTNDTEYDVVIALPAHRRAEAATTVAAAADHEDDDYVLGGYAGI